MDLQMFSIFDAKASVFGQPFFSFNGPTAQRTVAASMRDGSVLFAKFPEDYQLYHVGSFDDVTGVVRSTTPTVVCNLSALREVVHAS